MKPLTLPTFALEHTMQGYDGLPEIMRIVPVGFPAK